MKKKLSSLKRCVRTTLGNSHNQNSKNQKVLLTIVTSPKRQCVPDSDYLNTFEVHTKIRFQVMAFFFANFVSLRPRPLTF